MNNKIYLLAIGCLLLATSCKKAVETSSVQISQKELSNCQKVSCPQIDIEYVTVKSDTKASEKINAEIQNFIIASLSIGEKEGKNSASTIEKAMKDFAEISVQEKYSNKEVFSISCQNYLYTGGAHGYGAVSFLNFNPQTGKQLYYEDVFENVSDFEALAEKLFRQQQEIPKEGSINATGFWFEDDRFYLPETFGISKEFITLQYNQYDIASYAAGPIVVEIPIARVNDLLTISVE